MYIDEKKLNLINYLYNCDGWTTSADLSNALNMSVRSIKTYISEINADYHCIESSKNGYRIDREEARKIIAQAESSSLLSYEQRKAYIITEVIINKQHPSLDELCDVFCISSSTLDNFITKMRADLKNDNLVMNVKNDVIYINGSVDAISRATIKMLHNEIDESYFSMNRLQSFFTDLDLTMIKKTVTRVINEYRYYLDDYTLLNYVLHLALLIELNKGGNQKESEDIDEIPPFLHQQSTILEMVRKIYQELKKLYDASYTFTNICQASLLMMTRIVTKEIDDLTMSEVEDFIGPEIMELNKEIAERVKKNYGLDLNNERFLVRFLFHLKSLKTRLEDDVSITSFQFSTIKNDYPLLYDIACFCASVITEYFGYELSEDEITYIAIHLGLLIEERSALETKVSTVVLCPTHINYSFQKDFMQRLSSIFSESMIITEVNSTLDTELNLDNVDLIITTEKIRQPMQVRQVVVSPMLTESNIRSIFEVIDTIKKAKNIDHMKNSFLRLFSEELFLPKTSFKNCNEAIAVISDKMCSLGYVDENFREKLYEREKISPCSYLNIAIPHPLDFRSQKPAIAVAINSEPFPWGENSVSLVLMLALDQENSEKLRDFFDFIFMRLNDEQLFKKLIASKNYKEFINTLFN